MTAVRKITKEERYTYDDYKIWNDRNDWEIIGGIAYAMSPSPVTKHQRVNKKLLVKFDNYLEGKTCEVFSELDVVLSAQDIVRPDLTVVCDKNKVTEKNIQGVPDLVIEILSPSTSKKDRTIKLDLYRKFGVKEYWIVDTLYQEITVNVFSDNLVVLYSVEADEEEMKDSIIPVGIFGNDLKIDLKYIFD